MYHLRTDWSWTVSTISLVFIGLFSTARSATVLDSYFDWLSNQPEVLVSRAYDSQAQIENDIKAADPANRDNPPIYDATMNAARWSTKLGIASTDQLRPEFPLVSSGNLVLYWEARWDRAFLGDLGDLRQHKAFQLSRSGAGDERRIEIRTRFEFGGGEEIGMIDARGYQWNPSGAPLPGQIDDFYIVADTWTRFWAYIDFDRREFSLWVSDETRSPVRLFDALDFSDMSGGIDNFWFEFNTSQNPPGAAQTLYIWGRNFVALKNVSAIQEIVAGGALIRPESPRDLAAD